MHLMLMASSDMQNGAASCILRSLATTLCQQRTHSTLPLVLITLERPPRRACATAWRQAPLIRELPSVHLCSLMWEALLGFPLLKIPRMAATRDLRAPTACTRPTLSVRSISFTTCTSRVSTLTFLDPRRIGILLPPYLLVTIHGPLLQLNTIPTHALLMLIACQLQPSHLSPTTAFRLWVRTETTHSRLALTPLHLSIANSSVQRPAPRSPHLGRPSLRPTLCRLHQMLFKSIVLSVRRRSVASLSPFRPHRPTPTRIKPSTRDFALKPSTSPASLEKTMTTQRQHGLAAHQVLMAPELKPHPSRRVILSCGSQPFFVPCKS
jgi:hypothetical protein